jgi:hypothetical protein
MTMSTLAVTAMESNTTEISRRKAVARARRIAKRHHLRIVSYRHSDGYFYRLETAVSISGGDGDFALTLTELTDFCKVLARKEAR